MKLVFIAMVALVIGQFYLAYKVAFGSGFEIPNYLKGTPADTLVKVRPILATQHLLFGIACSFLLALFFLNLPVSEIKGFGAAVAAAVITIGLASRGIIYLKVRKQRKGS